MLTKDQKAKQVEDLSQRLREAKSVVFTKYRGVKIKDLEALRKQLKAQKVTFQVVKNTLLKRAFESANKTLPEELLVHPLAVAFGTEDDMAAPKAIVAFAKDTEALEIAGGVFEASTTSISKTPPAISNASVSLAKATMAFGAAISSSVPKATAKG